MTAIPLHEELDSIKGNALKDAYKAYAERLEAGMNQMVQRAQQRASLIPEQTVSTTMPIVKPEDQ